MKSSEAFILTKEQEQAVGAIKRAFAKAKKSGLFFANLYGTLLPFRRDMVESYDMYPASHGRYITNHGTYLPTGIDIPNEFTDDEHYIHFTQKGWKLHNSDDKF